MVCPAIAPADMGSILSEISWPAGGASGQGNQLFGPHGTGRYSAGAITTAKGFIGQYNESLTGFDYFHALSYDPAAGVGAGNDDGTQNTRQSQQVYDHHYVTSWPWPICPPQHPRASICGTIATNLFLIEIVPVRWGIGMDNHTVWFRLLSYIIREVDDVGTKRPAGRPQRAAAIGSHYH
jgi:hypothetical protein